MPARSLTLGCWAVSAQEVEADFHKQTESAKKREADLTDRVVKSRKELLSYQQGPQLQARDKVLNNLFIDEVRIPHTVQAVSTCTFLGP